MSRADLADEIDNAITGSLGPDWTTRFAAEAVVAHLEQAGHLRAEVPGDLMEAFQDEVARFETGCSEAPRNPFNCGACSHNFVETLTHLAAEKVRAELTALRRQLAAAIRSLRQQLADARKVRELEWMPYPNAVFAGPDIAVADAAFSHRYHVQRDPWAPSFMAYLHPILPITSGTSWWESKGHETLEAAKAAAQADYEQRILSALT